MWAKVLTVQVVIKSQSTAPWALVSHTGQKQISYNSPKMLSSLDCLWLQKVLFVQVAWRTLLQKQHLLQLGGGVPRVSVHQGSDFLHSPRRWTSARVLARPALQGGQSASVPAVQTHAKLSAWGSDVITPLWPTESLAGVERRRLGQLPAIPEGIALVSVWQCRHSAADVKTPTKSKSYKMTCVWFC